MRRRRGWQGDLSRFIQECESRDFSWADFNCALFAAEWVHRMTGIDLAGEYRGAASRQESIERMKEVCGGDVVDAARRALGEPLPSPLLARRGDVVAMHVKALEGGVSPALGIVDDSGASIVALGRKGLERAPLSAATHAWAVG